MASGPSTTVPLLAELAADAETAQPAQTGHEISPALWKQIFRYAHSLVGNHAEAEDITQEAFVALFQESRTVEQVGGWMRTVARRAVYRQYHRTRPDLHVSMERTSTDGELFTFEPIDPAPSAEERIIDETLLRMGARIIFSFPERERQCVMMYFRGYDFAQIALTLNVSRWTARRVTLKAVERLKNSFPRSGR